VEINSFQEEEVYPIVRESLRRELALFEMREKLITEEIKGFERKYGISSYEFIKKFEEGVLGDGQDCFEWWGLAKGLETVKDQIGKIRSVLSR